MTKTTQELIWIKDIFSSLNIEYFLFHLYCENQITLHIAKNPIFHERICKLTVTFY